MNGTGVTDRRAERRAERRRARAVRAAFVGALAPAVRAGLEQALAQTLLPHLGPAGVLGSYIAQDQEIDPQATESAAAALGWQIAFPRVATSAPLSFHETARADLRPGYKGIAEPPADSPAVSPDILLVPLVAIDAMGNRLGQGGGHYDRTLASLRAGGPVLAIGLAFDIQLVPLVRAEAWDQPLDAIATPHSFHHVGARAMTRP
jgi:5-formyltetrahydrofolate cyclo-ligase